jgi:hypothetical protein
MKQNLDELKEEVSKLQRQLAQIEALTKPSNWSSGGLIELKLVKLQCIKIKMYQEPSHSLPHVHIDYGRHYHVSSFAINNPSSRIEGSLPLKYDKVIIDWISVNHEKLLRIWDCMQSGVDPRDFIVELKGDT